MSDPQPFSVRAVQEKREAHSAEQTPSPGAGLRASPNPVKTPAAPGAAPSPGGFSLPIDPLRLAAAVVRHWMWIPVAALFLLVPAVVLGLLRFKTGYFATVQLIRREVTATLRASQLGEAFKPRQVTVATVVNVMLTPKLLERVGSQSRPPMTGSELRAQLIIKPERDTDLITVTFSSKAGARETADVLNRYATEVVALTAQMQSDEASELDRFLKGQLEQLDVDLKAVGQELLDFSRTSEFYAADREVEAYLRQMSELEIRLETARANAKAVDFRIASFESELARQSPVALELERARSSLASLKIAYADENPVIKDAQDKVAALESQMAGAVLTGTNSVAGYRYTDNTVANDIYLRLLVLYGERESLGKELAQIGDLRARVQERLKAVPEKGQRYAQIMARQQSLQAARDMLAGRQREAQVYKESSPGLYRLFAKATEEMVETSSRWKKILIVAVAAMVLGGGGALFLICGRELLDLRVVSVGDLRRATGARLTITLPELGGLDEQAVARWRFRAWSQLLREPELQEAERMFLAFASAGAGEGRSTLVRHLRDAAHDRGQLVLTVTNAPTGGSVRSMPVADAVASPESVARHFQANGGAPLELVVDGAWNWGLENRERWRLAMDAWGVIPALVILVELPPMTVGLDAVLAAGLMPAVVWVAASGRVPQRELGQILEMVKAADVHLVACALNREPRSLATVSILGRLGLATMFACGLLLPASAAPIPGEEAPAAVISATSQAPRLAPWQERFTVGAGDIFHLRIYGRSDSIRIYVPVGPDGRISFLEAQSVLVAGLTVDEMRARLDEELSKYYRNARTIVTPVEWHSKKYYVLGAVVDRGAYRLDRPVTIIEAVARARGIASGLFQHNTVELADLSRSFIVRAGKRLPVDFDKLFNRGDLTQNVLIEPGDYIYFPSGTVNEVYVLGAVRSPGPLGLTSGNSLMGVLTIRGGFMPEAYKQRVLVVRGGLDKPETFAVDTAGILAGKVKDFELKPKDIIYVAEKPWQRVEELAQMAINSFVQAMTAGWVGNNIKPLIGSGVLPKL